MKKLLISTIALIAFSTASVLAETTIVTVSMAKLFDGYYKSAEANSRLDSVRQQAVEEAQAKEKEIQDSAQEIQAMQEELQNPMLPEDAKAEKEAEIRAAIEAARATQGQYQQWQQQTSNDIQRRSNQVRASLVAEISKVVNDVALKEYNADLVFDTSDILGSGVPTVLYADSDLDITDIVLVELNKKAPSEEDSE